MFPQQWDNDLQSFEEDLGKVTINLGKIYKKKQSVFYEFDIRYPYGINAEDVMNQIGQITGKYKMTITDKKHKPTALYIKRQ